VFARCGVIVAVSLAACSHTDSFANSVPDIGPLNSSTDVLLTLNSGQNYWPTLTEDGAAVLYAYVDASEATVRPVTQFEGFPLHVHRCMGLIPVQGGTRSWEYCDNRGNEVDSLTSFTAFALASDGRLVYAESTTPRRLPFDSARVSLWLADSATPFRRTLLAKCPTILGDSVVNWFADISWTGPSTFLAVAQRMQTVFHAPQSPAVDSLFLGEHVVRGTIIGNTVTLIAVPGTAGATSYSVAEGGASIIFTQRDNLNLMKVPVAGGVPVVAAAATPRLGAQLVGVSCRSATCMVGIGEASPTEVRAVSIATGAAATVLSRSAQTLSSPLLTASGDVIAQFGPGIGRLQTFSSSANNTLHLYRALVP